MSVRFSFEEISSFLEPCSYSFIGIRRIVLWLHFDACKIGNSSNETPIHPHMLENGDPLALADAHVILTEARCNMHDARTVLNGDKVSSNNAESGWILLHEIRKQWFVGLPDER